jgi:hypothetical protein
VGFPQAGAEAKQAAIDATIRRWRAEKERAVLSGMMDLFRLAAQARRHADIRVKRSPRAARMG